MIVFITGASGFIGGQFLPQLLARLDSADRIYTLVREPEVPQDSRLVPLVGDLRSIDNHAAALLEAEWVFHLAANASFGDGAHYAEVNVRPVERMLAVLRRSQRLQRFVLVSTIGAVDRPPQDRITATLTVTSPTSPTSDYGRSKLAAEQVVRASGLPFTIIRPGWVYGARMRSRSHLHFMARLIERRPWAARLNPPGRVPLVHVADLGAALVRCLDQPATLGATYIAVTENRPIGDIFHRLHLVLHGRPPGWRLPWPRLNWLWGLCHARLPLTLGNLFVDYLAADDPAFARELLPAKPIKLEEGVKDLAEELSPAGGWWLVTGANSGIGHALIAALRAEGRRVVAVDRATDSLAGADDLRVVEADLTDSNALARIVAAVRGLRLSGLINNAGVGFRGGLLEQPWEQTEQTVRINILATLDLTHRLRAQLLRDGTTIVNVASSVAYHPLPHMSVYAASKAFILNWSLALSEELRQTNQVLTFSPSGTRTNFQHAAGVKGAQDANLLAPEAVARAILKTARRGERHCLLGLKSRVLVGGSRLLPIPVRLALWRWLFAATR